MPALGSVAILELARTPTLRNVTSAAKVCDYPKLNRAAHWLHHSSPARRMKRYRLAPRRPH